MQIIDTQITHLTAETGEPVTRLVFLGEGGEKIAVDMSEMNHEIEGDDQDNERDILQRARVMLVQTATFGIDDRSTPAPRSTPHHGTGEQAPTARPYLFEYREGEGSRRTSASMPSDETARDEAIRSAIDILDDEPAIAPENGWLVRVYDSSGTLVVSVDADQARARQNELRAATDI